VLIFTGPFAIYLSIPACASCLTAKVWDVPVPARYDGVRTHPEIFSAARQIPDGVPYG
jgi:hypothetical protein